MTTESYYNDVVRLARQLREHPIELDPPSPTTAGVYMIALHIDRSDLRAVSAVNNAFQLAFDAAGLAVVESTTEIGLDLIWGGAGSWREVFIISPRTSLGREQLNYVVGVALQALPLIPGINAAVGVALYSIFAGFMLVASTYDPSAAPVPVESVDADALAGAVVTAELYPPGKVWRPPAAGAQGYTLAKLAAYVSQQGDSAHFTVMQQAAGYDVALGR